ncbi:MAG: trigger factor [Defluviicoccus sp.]|nr:trigger factor [Defluviicoccus sp.]MDE0382825.1 trigger factor [Defluviicoccus sp.]
MQVTQISADGLRRAYRISVPAADIEDKVVARLTDLGREARIPGFRAGKAPLAILRRRFGEAVKGEVLQSAIVDATASAIDGEGIRPAMQPDIEDLEFEDGKDLEYTLALELMPEIEPPDLAAIALERMVVAVDEARVDEALGRLAEQHRHFSPAEDGAAAEDGDELVIDFEGSIDGEPFEGGAAEDFVLRLGSDRFVPGFEAQLLGARAGDEKTVAVDFPDDYPNDALKGRTASFAVAVKELRSADEAPIDDELARHVGADDLESLKARIREQIADEFERLSRARLKRSLLDMLAERDGFELPPGMVEREFETIWSQVEEAREKDGLDEDDKALAEDELRARYRAIAERRVRLALMLSEIGRANNIQVSEDELNRAMMEQARMMPDRAAQVFEFYRDNPAAMQSLQAPIFEDKVVDFVIEMAQVTDREVALDELTAEPAEPDAAPEEGQDG